MQLDDGGLTRLVSRRMGREITEKGRQELLTSDDHVAHVGIVSAKVDTLAYRMTLHTEKGEGSVIVNIALVDPAEVGRIVREIQLVAAQDLVMGNMIALAESGEELGGMIVPEGFAAIGTVCSLTLNGILQKAGVPVISRFGGLLEIKERRMTRFVNMIEYGGSTLDPLEIFIRADMTRVRNVVLRGSGIICASFREVPTAAVDQIKTIVKGIKKFNMGGVLAIGRPNQPLFGVNVSEGHCGMVVAGGLNAVAAAKELGIRLSFYSLAGLEDYSSFISAREVLRKFR
jgi:repressor of nif and glnA expression